MLWRICFSTFLENGRRGRATDSSSTYRENETEGNEWVHNHCEDFWLLSPCLLFFLSHSPTVEWYPLSFYILSLSNARTIFSLQRHPVSYIFIVRPRRRGLVSVQKHLVLSAHDDGERRMEREGNVRILWDLGVEIGWSAGVCSMQW